MPSFLHVGFRFLHDCFRFLHLRIIVELVKLNRNLTLDLWRLLHLFEDLSKKISKNFLQLQKEHFRKETHLCMLY